MNIVPVWPAFSCAQLACTLSLGVHAADTLLMPVKAMFCILAETGWH